MRVHFCLRVNWVRIMSAKRVNCWYLFEWDSCWMMVRSSSAFCSWRTVDLVWMSLRVSRERPVRRLQSVSFWWSVEVVGVWVGGISEAVLSRAC